MEEIICIVKQTEHTEDIGDWIVERRKEWDEHITRRVDVRPVKVVRDTRARRPRKS